MRSTLPVFLLSAALMGAPPPPQRGPFCDGTPSNDVVLQLSLSSTPSSAADPTLTLVFRNTSEHPVALASPQRFGHSLLLAITRDGKSVSLSGSLTGLIPGNPLILRPGGEQRLTRRLRSIEGFNVPSLDPGPHLVFVCYRDPGVRPRGVRTPKGTTWPELILSNDAPLNIP